MIYFVADVDKVYVKMICEIKKIKTLDAKLVCLCGGLRENGARLNSWWSFVAQSLKLVR